MNIVKQTTLPPIEVGYRIDAARPVIPLAMEVSRTGCAAPHHHPRGQFIYASSGVMRILTPAGAWVVPPSQAVWVPPEIEHEVYFPGQVSLRNLFIDPSAVAGLPTACCVLKVGTLLRELVRRAVAVGDGYRRHTPEWRLMQVLLDELRRAEPSPLHLPAARDPRVCRVTEALQRQPGDDRDLAAWAKVACASSRTLARLFVRDTGMTFGMPGLFLVADPQQVGERIARGVEEGRDVLYVPGFWRLIMWIIRTIPETVFKRLKL